MDGSFRCWHISIRCDDPRHKAITRRDPDEDYFGETEPDQTKHAWRDRYRENGFIFHRDGRVTCPQCARSTANPSSKTLRIRQTAQG